MIHGLLIDVKAEELVELLRKRVVHHESSAKACEVALRKQPKRRHPPEDDGVASSVAESPVQRLARRKREHAERATALAFVRDHLVQGETYRLSDRDLRLADLVPERFSMFAWKAIAETEAVTVV